MSTTAQRRYELTEPTLLHQQLMRALKLERVDGESWIAEYMGRRFQVVRLDPEAEEAEVDRAGDVDGGPVKPAEKPQRVFVAELVHAVGSRTKVDRFEPVGESPTLAGAVNLALMTLCEQLKVRLPIELLPDLTDADDARLPSDHLARR